MRFPKNKGFLNGVAYAIHNYWQRSFWIRWVLTPLITGIIPALVVAYYSIDKFGNLTKQYIPAVAASLDDHAWLVMFSAFIYPTLLIAAARFVLDRVSSNGVDRDTLLSLMAVLDRIVGCKAKRFGEYVVAGKKNEAPFEAITQPQSQIMEITRGVCELFNVLLAEAKPRTLIKVVLAETQGNKIASVPVYFPEDEPVRVDIKVLNQMESTMMTALRTKKMVIIESTKKELHKKQNRRYVIGEEDDKDADGSLICFPIRHEWTKSVPFILSIHSDVAGAFRQENSELYEHLLGRFGCRISLEYSLMKIKEGG
jgi:hypothetical protein